MPMPKPTNDEDHDQFMERCMGEDTMMEDFEEPAQRRAVCERQWRDHMEERDGKAAVVEIPAKTMAILYPRVLQAVLSTPWAITPEKMGLIVDFLAIRAAGGRVDPDTVAAAFAQQRQPGRPSNGAVAVLPLWGVMARRANMMTEMSGGTSIEKFVGAFRQAMADPVVGAILLDVDSPGGNVDGVTEAHAEILAARGQKPIVAIADSLAASAAYWLATAAEEIVATPSAQVGSIGVYAAHEDMSKAMEMAGRRVTLVSAGKYKAEANPFQPLTDEARAAIQGSVDQFYDMFVRDVAKGRTVQASEVRAGFGEGRTVMAREALRLGMIDRIATLEDTLARLAGGRKPGAMRAEGHNPAAARARLLRITE